MEKLFISYLPKLIYLCFDYRNPQKEINTCVVLIVVTTAWPWLVFSQHFGLFGIVNFITGQKGFFVTVTAKGRIKNTWLCIKIVTSLQLLENHWSSGKWQLHVQFWSYVNNSATVSKDKNFHHRQDHVNILSFFSPKHFFSLKRKIFRAETIP